MCFLPARLCRLGRDLPQGYVLLDLQHVDDKRFEPENKKAHINQNVQVQIPLGCLMLKVR